MAGRYLLTTLPPITLAAVRFALAAMVFLPIVAWDMLRGHRIDRRDLPMLAGLGFLGITLYFWLHYLGLNWVESGIGALLWTGSIPIFTALLAPIVLKEPLSRSKAVGLGVGFVGVLLVLAPKIGTFNLSDESLLGGGIIILSSVSFALYTVLGRRYIINRPPVTFTAYLTILGTLMMLPASIVAGWEGVLSLSGWQWIALAYLAFACSFGAYLMWFYALSRLEAVRTAVWLYFAPVVAVLGGALLLGEAIALTSVLGGAIIFLSLWLVTK